MTVTVYRSKTDTWLVAVIVTAVTVVVVATAFALAVAPAWGRWVAILAFGASTALPLWVLMATDYTLDAAQLAVRSGPFRWRISLAEIHGITPTSSPLSSPALSLDRLRIEYGAGRSLMISPRDRERFLRDVERRREMLVSAGQARREIPPRTGD